LREDNIEEVVLVLSLHSFSGMSLGYGVPALLVLIALEKELAGTAFVSNIRIYTTILKHPCEAKFSVYEHFSIAKYP